MAMKSSNNDLSTNIHISNDQLQSAENVTKNSDKKKRQVRFPADALISDYLEPFRSVPDNCTSEELIGAYIDACFQYKVQPIGFLLEQLKGIDLSICNERYSRLSLKGFRLTRAHVETLEEIFRRVHFRELDLEETYLDDQSATALFDMLLHYETCNELKISLNFDKGNFGQAWAQCVTYLRRSEQLHHFFLSHTPLSVSHFLGMSFFGLSTERLSLRNCGLSGQALFGLVRWIRLLLASPSLEPPPRIRSITSAFGQRHLAQSSRCPRRVKCLHRFVSEQSKFDSFPVWQLQLDVSDNKLLPSDAETLLTLVRHQLLIPNAPLSCKQQQKNCASSSPIDQDTGEVESSENALRPIGGIGFLSKLDLSQNNLGDEGLRTLCAGLIQRNRNRIKQLYSPDSTSDTCPTDTLILNLSKDVDSAVHMDFFCRGLESLILAKNNLTASGMHALSLVLAQIPLNLVHRVSGLITLDLSYNAGIGDQGVEILCSGLIRNHTLKEIFLRSVQMSFPGIFALSGFLGESKCLQLLDIRGNDVNISSLMAVAKTLALNHTLTSFLSDARALANSNNLLDASDMELIIWLIDEIESCLQRNRRRSELPDSSSSHDNNAVFEVLNDTSEGLICVENHDPARIVSAHSDEIAQPSDNTVIRSHDSNLDQTSQSNIALNVRSSLDMEDGCHLAFENLTVCESSSMCAQSFDTVFTATHCEYVGSVSSSGDDLCFSDDSFLSAVETNSRGSTCDENRTALESPISAGVSLQPIDRGTLQADAHKASTPSISTSPPGVQVTKHSRMKKSKRRSRNT